MAFWNLVCVMQSGILQLEKCGVKWYVLLKFLQYPSGSQVGVNGFEPTIWANLVEIILRLHLMIWSNLFETWIWYVQILKGQSANLWFWDNLGRGSRLEFSKLKRVTFWSKRSPQGIFCTSFFFASPSRRLSHRWFPEWPFGPKGRPLRKTMSKTQNPWRRLSLQG